MRTPVFSFIEAKQTSSISRWGIPSTRAPKSNACPKWALGKFRQLLLRPPRLCSQLANASSQLLQILLKNSFRTIDFSFNPNYESLKSSEPWADRTLRAHSTDARKYVYNETQLDAAETHDPLWNAAQKQMVLSGWMHGYLRMYWAKKILEWSRSPAEAYDIAVRLNDRYELD